MIVVMIYYEYNDFKADIPKLREQCESFNADTIIAVARGGMTLAHALSEALHIRNVQSIRVESYDDEHQREEIAIRGSCDLGASTRVLIVDDIVDSGRTLTTLIPLLKKDHPDIEFRSAALFTKSTALIQPDYSLHEAAEWIDFFWGRDFLKPDLL